MPSKPKHENRPAREPDKWRIEEAVPEIIRRRTLLRAAVGAGAGGAAVAYEREPLSVFLLLHLFIHSTVDKAAVRRSKEG